MSDECPYCGEDFLFGSDDTIYGCDVRISPRGGDQFLTWRGCCEDMVAEVEIHGFDAAYGIELAEVARMISGLEVLEILDHGDGTIVARLVTVDPATDAGDDGTGHRRAASPKGWRDEVREEVDRHHRHHNAPLGHKFSVAVCNGETRVGVAMIGRPVARALQAAQPDTLEVTRVCTWGHPELRRNASSKLYAAAANRARALGYDRLITYTIAGEESGGSLVASGWTPTAITGGGSWSRPSRAREDNAPTGAKVRWERGLTKSTRRAVAAAAITLG